PAAPPPAPTPGGAPARRALDGPRAPPAAGLAARRTEVPFVVSGPEAVTLALLGGAARLPRSAQIVTWAAEHQSVLASIRHLQEAGREVRIAGVDRDARVDPDAIRPGTALVSVGLANNEVGTIQPVPQIIERARDVGALVHLDACAGARWIPIPDGADIVSISGHKLGAGR